MGRRQYEEQRNYPELTPEGVRLGNKILRVSIIGTVAMFIVAGSVLAIWPPAH